MNRLQQNFVDKNQETTNKDEFIMIYKYLVLKREKFFSMKEKEFSPKICWFSNNPIILHREKFATKSSQRKIRNR